MDLCIALYSLLFCRNLVVKKKSNSVQTSFVKLIYNAAQYFHIKISIYSLGHPVSFPPLSFFEILLLGMILGMKRSIQYLD